MTDPTARLVDAEREVIVARQRLSSTVQTLQAKLDPKTLAQKATNEISDCGAAAAKAGVASARRNPAIVAGVAILAGLFFVRRPIANAFRHGRHAISKAGKRPNSSKE